MSTQEDPGYPEALVQKLLSRMHREYRILGRQYTRHWLVFLGLVVGLVASVFWITNQSGTLERSFAAGSTSFAIGSRVQTTERLNVRATPSTSGIRSCRQYAGTKGTIIGGPVSANGYTWWNINYDVQCSGWSVENYLTALSSPSSDTTPPISVCNDKNTYEITSPNSIYEPRTRKPTSYIIPGSSIKLGLKNLTTGAVDYEGNYSFVSSKPDKVSINGNAATDIVKKYDDYDLFIDVSIPDLSACKNITQPMRVLIGDPFLGSNIAFIYPKSIVPAQVLPSGQTWATISVEQMMQKFDFVKITDLAYSFEKRLFNRAPFANGVVLFGLMPPWCGGSGMPTGFGLGCLIQPNNEPQWGVVYHEMGHDFTAHFLVRFVDGIGGTYPNNTDFFENWSRSSALTPLEAIPTLAWMYAGQHLVDESQSYGISDKIRDSIQNKLTVDINGYINDLATYESKGNNFATINPNILDGMFIKLANDKTLNPYGWELYPKTFKIYLDPLPSFITAPLTEIQGHTYFIAGLSAAAGVDLRPKFKAWNFPIDDGYYNSIYAAVSSIVNSGVTPPPPPPPPPIPPQQTVSIVTPAGASSQELLAAKEIRRYIYLRTGNLLPIVDEGSASQKTAWIVAGEKSKSFIKKIAAVNNISLVNVHNEGYLLKTFMRRGHKTLLIAGGNPIGALYGAYRFAEDIGVRFYLDGDVIPDERMALAIPSLNENQSPLFALRGILPFHDFSEGPDWWNKDQYLSVATQLAKLRMNFMGLHTYPEPIAEPTVWIGQAKDAGDGTGVKKSYASRYNSTLTNYWGLRPKRTSEFPYGVSNLFERDAFGADVMADLAPQPQTPEAANELFDRVGAMLKTAFTYARTLGIKNAVGTEAPLTIPQCAAQGLTGNSSVRKQQLYQGIFTRIAKTYPIDYYWLWTPEGWLYNGSDTPLSAQETVADMLTAFDVLKNMGAPFKLAASGWTIGPAFDKLKLDKELPKEIPISSLGLILGREPVDSTFGAIQGRSKWVIPWLEDDPLIISPQLWAGRMRKDAQDALHYGADGLIGIHWRTKVIGPNISALSQAAWNQSGWNGTVTNSRFAPVADFYVDFTRHQFGPEVSAETADIFQKIDGQLPIPSEWGLEGDGGPGSITPDDRPWSTVKNEYTFADQFAALAPKVKGIGNRERFNYWMNQFLYTKTKAELRTVWGEYNRVMSALRSEPDPSIKKQKANTAALPLRLRLVSLLGKMYDHFIATISTPGELGVVANFSQKSIPLIIEATTQELEQYLGSALPSEAFPPKNYQGTLRVIVPTLRTSLTHGEDFTLKVLILSQTPLSDAFFYWRPFESPKEFSTLPLQHIARGVYTITLPSSKIKERDFEYYVRAKSETGEIAYFPATAPSLNQTVIIDQTQIPQPPPFKSMPDQNAISSSMQCSLWTEIPGDGSTPNTPAGIFANDHFTIFVRGTDNKIYQNRDFSSWSEVPGSGLALDGPEAVADEKGNLQLFVRGTDNAIYTTTKSEDNWSGWSQVPGNGFTLNAPNALQEGTKTDLFVRGTDDKIYMNTRISGNWSGWREVPGNGSTKDTPSAVLDSNNTLHLFVHGTDDKIYVNRRNASDTWSGWNEIPGEGRTIGVPTTALDSSGFIHLYVQGTDKKVYRNRWDGKTWFGWRAILGDMLTLSGPEANSVGEDIWVTVRGENNKIYINKFPD